MLDVVVEASDVEVEDPILRSERREDFLVARLRRLLRCWENGSITVVAPIASVGQYLVDRSCSRGLRLLSD